MRAKQVEDALFIANDKFDEVNKEKHELAEQLSMIDQRHQEERENWDIEKSSRMCSTAIRCTRKQVRNTDKNT